MPTFEYKATTLDGKVSTGQREGANEESIIDWLRDSEYIPISVEEIAANKLSANKSFSLLKSNQLTSNQILEVTEQLSTLVKSKLPLDHAFEKFYRKFQSIKK